MSSESSATPADQFRATVERGIDIDASADVIFESVLDDLRAIVGPDGQAMNFRLEAFPGGRWFRDLGNDAGHCWGHVQVIKPPTLLEIYGPLMISSAAISHVSYRVTPEGSGHRLTIKHRLFGDFDPKLPEMVGGGWQQSGERIKAKALAKKA